MAEQGTQRNLLAGILALQLDFVRPEDLVAALRVWSDAKSRSVAEILAERGNLDAKRRDLIDLLVAEHLKQHADDPEQCLAALSVAESLRDDLLRIADPDIAASVSLVRSHVRGKEEKEEANADPYSTQHFIPQTIIPKTDAAPVSGTVPQETADPFATRIVTPTESKAIAAARESRSHSAERYRVLRMHAKGGLGLVSVAVDGELHREVALKEIQRQHADNVSSRSRFMIEAEITGRLEHPGIVPVYGLGQYEDGRPYYAMRFIRGQSLRKAIDEYHLTLETEQPDPGERLLQLRNLLTRFIAVCQTMEYSHTRGILHRDLKPDNIMLGDFGETLVVDWGLAKAMGQTESEKDEDGTRIIPSSSGSTSETLPGSAIGTPQYMSPEQAAGDLNNLTPASDIYSLGATLYHLLTGTTMYERTPLLEVLRRVGSGEWKKPRERKPDISPALEAVCLKALALKPEDRYASAREMSVDIEHWLADEPVSVYQEPFSQRMARWTRRHRAAAQATVLSLAVIAVVAVAATIVINVARKREALAKTEATQRSKQARGVIDSLLTSVGTSLENHPGMQEARKRLLQRAADDYLQLTDANSTDPELRGEAALALTRLGDVRTVLNQLDEADKAYGSAEELFRELIAADKSRSDFQVNLGICLNQHGLALAARGKADGAEQIYGKALAVLEPVVKAKPKDADAADALGTVLVNLGRRQADRGKASEAEATLKRAGGALENVAQAKGAAPRIRFAFAGTRSEYAQFLVTRGREVDAIPVFDEAIRTYGSLVNDFPGEAQYLSSRGSTRVLLAAALRDAGRYDDEIGAYRRAVEDYTLLLAGVPDVPRYRENLAITRSNLGQTLQKLGQNPAALSELKKSYAELDALAIEFPAVASYLEGLAATGTTLAEVQLDLAQFDEAQKEIDQALVFYRQLVEAMPDIPRYHADLGVALEHRARILARRNMPAEAEQEFQNATASLQKAIAADPHDPHFRENLAMACSHWAWQRHVTGDSDGSRAAVQQAIGSWEALINEFPKTARFANGAAWLLATGPVAELRDLSRAKTLAEQATTLAPLNDFCWRTMGAVQLEAMDNMAAQSSLKKAYELRPSDVGVSVFLLAIAEWQLGNKDAARERFESASSWTAANKPGDDELARIRKRAADTLGVK